MTDLEGRYRLGDVLGRGGVADVYRARDLVLDRDVAVKMLRESVDDSDRSRFVGEARMLAGLSHPSIVTVLDVGVAEGHPFLVMELVEGPTLAAALHDGPLPPDQVAEIGAALASALAHAHEQGAVHRDVKPANVLLGPGGAKLADFGIARLVGDTVHHTRTGTTIGTPAYLSPEQVGGSDVGPPTDVYSLGLVLLEALTGERAFPGSPTESAVARLHRPPEIPSDLSAGWSAILAAMTATDPSERPPADAAAARMPVPGTVPPPGTAGPPTATLVLEPSAAGSVGRRPAKAVGAVVAVAVVVAGVAVAGQVLGDRGESPDAPDTPPTASSTTEPETRETEGATGTSQDEASGDETPTEQADKGKGKGKGKDEGKDKDKGKGGGKNKGGGQNKG
ncbi:serine/threonine-protein kinase [Nocardioides sp. HM23]|uniref:serine/threonine-protein kinase n=1 Tax=Nocardioides bizhenqiangii TaxID=3095076 RepID=UPI002ACADBB7|nr:serine/threonine-protein kinase [Nocardioides sp. HM23]MDZ5623533.1 serine/threonine-protein kinase [Nocardioides sp. HM23]